MKQVISRFNGRWNRGRDTNVPLDHALSELNNRFTLNGVETREGYAVGQSFSNIVRVHTYRLIGAAERFLVLNTSGELFDLTNSMVTPILTIAAMTDFSVQVMFNRLYITPHNGLNGIASNYVYVYEGTGTARAAAGVKPAAAFTGVTTPAAGNIDAGQYVFSVCYEYASGYISPPQTVANRSVVVMAGGTNARIAGIPIGGTGVVARILVSSKRQTTVSGDVDGYELFKIPSGRVADNVTTTYDVNFYSTQLVDSIQYIENQLETIPAGLGLCEYQGSLVVWAEEANKSVIRISKPGEPESFSSVDGFINVKPGDSSSAVRNCVEFRGSLDIRKDHRTYTMRDNGGVVASWVPIDIDKGIGTSSSYGTGVILDTQGANVDEYVVASISGLFSFSGAYPERPLSYKFQDDWSRINKAYFYKVQVVVDSVGKYIYINVPLDSSTTINYMFMIDYNEGLNWKDIRCSLWQLADVPSSILLVSDFTTKKTKLYFADSAAIYAFLIPEFFNQWLDNDTAISSHYQTALVPGQDQAEGSYQFNLLKIFAEGDGTLGLNLYSENSIRTQAPTGIALSTTPDGEYERKINFVSHRMSVKFSQSTLFKYYKLNKVIVEFVQRSMRKPG